MGLVVSLWKRWLSVVWHIVEDVGSLASKSALLELTINEHRAQLDQLVDKYAEYQNKMKLHEQCVAEFEQTQPDCQTLVALQRKKQVLTKQGLAYLLTVWYVFLDDNRMLLTVILISGSRPKHTFVSHYERNGCVN